MESLTLIDEKKLEAWFKTGGFNDSLKSPVITPNSMNDNSLDFMQIQALSVLDGVNNAFGDFIESFNWLKDNSNQEKYSEHVDQSFSIFNNSLQDAKDFIKNDAFSNQSIFRGYCLNFIVEIEREFNGSIKSSAENNYMGRFELTSVEQSAAPKATKSITAPELDM